MSARKRWVHSVGHPPYVVHYGELAGKASVYIWWRRRGKRGTNWAKRSLQLKLRDSKGAIIKAVADKALERAKLQYERLSGQRAEAEPNTRSGPLTLADTWQRITDPKRGKYPSDTPYRRGIKAAINFARGVLGHDFLWMHFGFSQLQEVVRAKVDQVAAHRETAGWRAAESVGESLIIVGRVLRDRDRVIPRDTPLPSGPAWREELKAYVRAQNNGRMPEVKRPRYTMEQALALIDAAAQVDPRFELLIELSAEYRAGQAVRAMRTDLQGEGDNWTFEIHGRGKKKGAVVDLIPVQVDAVQRALAGYLSKFEAQFQAGALADYWLFPKHRLRRGVAYRNEGHLVKNTLNGWIRKAKRIADIPHVTGEAFYGARRVLLDKASEEGISDEGMMEWGGWSDTDMPKTVYRDKVKKKARAEAAAMRERVRGRAARKARVGDGSAAWNQNDENVPNAYPEGAK